ncbi:MULTISPECIES: restriction endonuclease [unclassified Lysobacter]|uniref:restriction endonuclease n=1 Tax=unclassified Lysobacter TaxID=2635362 RepID=UPI000701C92E|nr:MULTISPECIES: restriction endonuclease [unclassified Lysobacter]KRC36589.1 restriction endonuclease [Lysobacter sp. Root76]KRD66682.1 restriction endonuclease [Lysobacter sp. Root96]
MNELTLHPNVYATGASKGLIHVLERVWVREHTPGDGTIFVISGFGNYNGGVRFFESFREHKRRGGELVAVFAGSTSARLTSKQVVHEMLDCGADVHIVNRKRLLHAKCYGTSKMSGDSLIVTSGNFTGPGMSQNVEMSVLLDADTTAEMGFSWGTLLENLLDQRWNYHRPTLGDPANPAWSLLYDEQAADIRLDETEEVTMLIRLSHADTARINATPGTSAGLGSQYFWLSKDCYDFFPPLTIRNQRGLRATYSCLISMLYVDLNVTDDNCRVTFEAENNLDFRLGTGPLRYTRLAAAGDLAAVTRLGENNYELRIYRAGAAEYQNLMPYAVNLIGHQGKQYGYISNAEFSAITGTRFRLRR